MNNFIRVDFDGYEKGELVNYTPVATSNNDELVIQLGLCKDADEINQIRQTTLNITQQCGVFLGGVIYSNNACYSVVMGTEGVRLSHTNRTSKINYKSYRGKQHLNQINCNPYINCGTCKIGNSFEYNLRTKEMKIGSSFTNDEISLINEFLINWTDLKALLLPIDGTYELMAFEDVDNNGENVA